MPVKRLYNHKDVDMLTAAHVMTQNFMNKIHELSSLMTCWTKEMALKLREKIDYGFKHYLGMNTQDPLYDASLEVNNIRMKAMKDLADLRNLIKNRFNHQSDRLLNTLGYQKYFQTARGKNQEALIFLLTTFKEQVEGGIKENLVSQGVNPKLIDRIIAYRDPLYEANIQQESLKLTTPVRTNERIKYFNEIYSEVMGISKIAYRYYYHDPATRELFSFSRIVRNLNASRGNKPKDKEDDTE
jgi:hypothetical protein